MLPGEEKAKLPVWIVVGLVVATVFLVLAVLTFGLAKFCQDHSIEINGIRLYRPESQ